MSNTVENIVKDLKRLGNEQLKNGDFQPTLDYCKNILYSNIDDWSVYFNIGKYLKQISLFDLAVEFFERAVELNPEYADAYWFIGDVYNQNLNNQEKAIFYFEKYAQINPQDYNIYDIIGFLYQKIDPYENIDEQIKYFKKALDVKPDFVAAIRNLAFAFARAEKYQQSVEYCHRLLELSELPDDYFFYGCLKIKLGDFEEGWKYYEYRFLKEFTPTPYPKFVNPKWQGQEISDKTLLVQFEQGFGDSIQFFRYLPQLLPKAKKVIFRVQEELVDLMKLNSHGVEIVGESAPLNELSFDYHIPIMSLPLVLSARVDNIALPDGYLRADEDKVQEFKAEFFNNDCFKIGISWHGSAIGKENRNIPVECFYPLTGLKNVKVYSFQKGENLSQSEIVNLGESFNDFSDTAAAMANIDLFVTSDNSLFNLAGAMGKRTFALLSKDSEWRWFLDEEKTPWYDSVKIFKKRHENEDWDILMQRALDFLNNIR